MINKLNVQLTLAFLENALVNELRNQPFFFFLSCLSMLQAEERLDTLSEEGCRAKLEPMPA